VGNFGDGLVHVYDINSGDLGGPLEYQHGRPIVLSGLWGLSFATTADFAGNDLLLANSDLLVAAAGIDEEQNGLISLLRSALPFDAQEAQHNIAEFLR
jgi:hypothetical protein